MMKRLLFFYLIILYTSSAAAQVVARGLVLDSVTNAPLEMATVTLLRDGKSVSFTKTNSQGKFALSIKEYQEADRLAVSFLGYGRQIVPLLKNQMVTIHLHPESFILREVTIKAGRIYGRLDTISYDISRFADSRDNSLKDVLRKLPGIDVGKDGTISYNGKAISRFTVEGLDLTGGRYNLINDNLKAKDVAKAEIIEHDQPIKILQKKITTDNVAMNVKLKPGARDKWILTLSPVLKMGDTSDEANIGGQLAALRIGKLQQSLYSAELDRTGRDLSLSAKQLAPDDDFSSSADEGIPLWYGKPQLVAPIDADRLRFNTSGTVDINRTSKTKRGNEIRLSAGYLHHTIRQSTENHSLYYLNGSKPVQTDEYKQFLMREDKMRIALNSEINADNSYSMESLKVEATRMDGSSRFLLPADSVLNQQIRLPMLSLVNRFYRFCNFGKSVFSFRSLLRLEHSSSSLQVDADKETMPTTDWYTDNSLTWLRKIGLFSLSCTSGFTAEYLRMKGNNGCLSLYADPRLEYKRSSLTMILNNRMEWKRFPAYNVAYLNMNPQLSLFLKSGFHHEWYAGIFYNQHVGGWTSFLLPSYRQDYRTMIVTDGTMPLQKFYGGSLDYTYKRPVNEFFWNASANYQVVENNLIADLQIIDNKYQYHWAKHNHTSVIKELKSIISKGLYDCHLKLKLKADYTWSNGKQSSGGFLSDYSNRSFRLEPQLIFSPVWGEINYSGEFAWNKMSVSGISPLKTMMDWKQSLTLTKTIGKVDISATAAHYRNELQSSSAAKTLFVDASVVWRTKKVRFELRAKNLFDKQNYRQTVYSGISSMSDNYILRPREFLLALQWSL